MKRVTSLIILFQLLLLFALNASAEMPTAVDTAGKAVATAIDIPDADSTEAMVRDLELLREQIGDAEAAMKPFCMTASSYPADVTIYVEDPESFVGLLCFRNGRWIRLDTFSNRRDSSIRFLLKEPSVLLEVYAGEDNDMHIPLSGVPVGIIAAALIMSAAALIFFLSDRKRKEPEKQH